MSYTPNPNNVKLGMVVKSTIYGTVGITTSRAESLNGMIQFTVKSPDPEDGNPKVKMFDAPDLSETEDEALKPFTAIQPPQKHDISLGDEVIVEYNGIKGTVVELDTNISGDVKAVLARKGSHEIENHAIVSAALCKRTGESVKPKKKETGCMSVNTSIAY